MPTKPIVVAVVTSLWVGGLCAKELPPRKADEPREDKRADQACAYLGQGYTRAPGSDTCVRVGGSVRFDGVVQWER